MFDIIVLDLDGTLLKNDKTVSPETLQALRNCEELGNQIVIATARPPRLGDVTLPKELEKEFMIFYNGAEIYHNKEKIYSKCISCDSLNYIKECGIGVAMGNATLAVKKAADYITKSNEEDGIAVYLNSLELYC